MSPAILSSLVGEHADPALTEQFERDTRDGLSPIKQNGSIDIVGIQIIFKPVASNSLRYTRSLYIH